MDRKPLIWRPNAIPQVEWDAKSRDEQIAWWKNNGNTDDQKTNRSMFDVPAYYENGTIHLNACIDLLFKHVNHDETLRFLDECPDQRLNALREESLHDEGDDPHNWPRTYYMASYAPWVCAEDIEASRHAEQQKLWDGVAILKHHLKTNGG